jgi:hypothetical protein
VCELFDLPPVLFFVCGGQDCQWLSVVAGAMDFQTGNSCIQRAGMYLMAVEAGV